MSKSRGNSYHSPLEIKSEFSLFITVVGNNKLPSSITISPFTFVWYSYSPDDEFNLIMFLEINPSKTLVNVFSAIELISLIFSNVLFPSLNKDKTWLSKL